MRTATSRTRPWPLRFGWLTSDRSSLYWWRSLLWPVVSQLNSTN
jgi:hypothetical protein